ncbi:MAG TPA: flagellar hook-basal body complex protein, partial [Stellaceae bacterium]|nr:flagellar hook-basal body complex protein [Stellaceae bacterium]
MSLTGAFNTSVAGLYAYSEAMSTISQNIANQRTPGYKRVETDFATVLGGVDINPHEPGGVRALTKQIVDVQGTIETTGRAFDLAINGQGMFVYSSTRTGSGDLTYSRAGNMAKVVPDDINNTGFLGNESGEYLMGWQADQNGNFNYGDASTLVAIPATSEDPFPGLGTTTATLSAVLPASGTSGATQILYYDSAGAAQTLNLNWTKTGANVWQLDVTDLNGAPVASFTQTFDGLGNLTSADTLTIGSFTLDVSNISQFGTTFFRNDYQQDGLAQGEFIRYNISEDGKVYGFFSSGAVKPLYQVALATFANPNYLQELPANRYVTSDRSGPATLRQPGDDFASLVTESVEMSNFDLADG